LKQLPSNFYAPQNGQLGVQKFSEMLLNKSILQNVENSISHWH
jgi:hypothetical protein